MEKPKCNDIEKDIIEAILTQKSSLKLPYDTEFNDIVKKIRVFMRKHPEVFWFSHQYHWDEKTSTLFFKYNFTPEKKSFFEEQITKAVTYLFQPDKLSQLSDLEKVGYVYKWIVSNTTYNEFSSFNQTIYSVLINRNSVCTGYAKTAQYLLATLGMESQLVLGKFHNDDSLFGRHCWNIVKIDGQWYHVDFCLADKSLKHLLNVDEVPIERGGILWNYFCTSTEQVLSNRSIEHMDEYPPCDMEIDLLSSITLLRPVNQLAVCKSDSGSSARVYLDSYDKDTVIKIAREDKALIHNEYDCLLRLADCPHVLKAKGLVDDGVRLEQLVPWSELLNSHYYKPDERQLKDVLIQLTMGLIECRKKGIVYSDIHYNNVFVTKDGTFKWGDFGIAFDTTEDSQLPLKMIGADGLPLGSRWFMAPETFNRRLFTESSAIYSLAMLAYFVMNGMRPPFWSDEDNQNESISLRLNGKSVPQPVFVDRYRGLWPLIIKALSWMPGDRPCSYEAFLTLLMNLPIVDVDGYVDEMKVCNTEEVEVNQDIIEPDLLASTGFNRWGDGGIHDSDSFACTCGLPICPSTAPETDSVATAEYPHKNPLGPMVGIGAAAAVSAIGGVCGYAKSRLDTSQHEKVSYGVVTNSSIKKKSSFLNRLFGKKSKEEYLNACAYAPAEIQPCKEFIVRIFIHKDDEAVKVDSMVKSIDRDAVRKAYRPLDFPVKDGDRISIVMRMSNGVSIDEYSQTFVWRGRFVETDFICKLLDRKLKSVSGKAMIVVNDVPCGELKFIIDVVADEADKRYAKVESRKYSKIFISYAHADYSQVRGIAEGCRMNGSDYFFDRHTLKAGDLFKDKILEYIDNADLFVLCWSKHAAESEWVQIERKHALNLIEKGNTSLAIYPLSMPPEAPLPEDMSDKYNFATL